MDSSALEDLVAAATEGMRKTQSADEIQDEAQEAAGPAAPGADGHQSDSAVPPTRERKKGVPWTEDEHRLFLLGLQKLGKGDWRGISRHFVQSRTPTQVASHAQKYFIRQSNLNKRKRRSSLFDIVSEVPPRVSDRDASGAGPSGDDAEEAKNPNGSRRRNQAQGQHQQNIENGGQQQPVVGGLSMAFGGGGLPPVSVPHLGGYNPTGIPPPASFSMHATIPPSTSGAVSKAEGDAAAATIAALSMAGSPAAAAGYAAAAAAAAARAGVSASAPAAFAGVNNQAAAAVAANPFAALMASMGQMATMGQMGMPVQQAQQPQMGDMNGFSPQANWMAHYHQFLQQMAQHQQHGLAPPAGVTFPPAMPFAQNPAMAAASAAAMIGGGATLCKPTAQHASPASAVASGAANVSSVAAGGGKAGDEPAAMVAA